MSADVVLGEGADEVDVLVCRQLPVCAGSHPCGRRRQCHHDAELVAVDAVRDHVARSEATASLQERTATRHCVSYRGTGMAGRCSRTLGVRYTSADQGVSTPRVACTAFTAAPTEETTQHQTTWLVASCC